MTLELLHRAPYCIAAMVASVSHPLAAGKASTVLILYRMSSQAMLILWRLLTAYPILRRLLTQMCAHIPCMHMPGTGIMLGLHSNHNKDKAISSPTRSVLFSTKPNSVQGDQMLSCKCPL